MKAHCSAQELTSAVTEGPIVEDLEVFSGNEEMVVAVADHLVDGHLHRDRFRVVHGDVLVVTVEQRRRFPGQGVALRTTAASEMTRLCALFQHRKLSFTSTNGDRTLIL